jgi:hypothetical protein
VRQAYGIKSGTQEHLLLMDFDENDNDIKNYVQNEVWSNLRQRFPKAKIIMYDTENGFHVIVFKRFPFREALIELVKTPYIDLNHVCIGVKRGYWFLETKLPIPLIDKNVEFMKIERGVSE